MTILPPSRPPSAAMGPALAMLTARLADTERRLAAVERAQRTAQLASSSVENGAITFNDAAGTPMIVAGLQTDGTHGIVHVSPYPPDQPDDPLVSAGIGGLYVIWDGLMADGSTPLSDFGGVQVHVSDTQGFTPDVTTMQGTMTETGIFGVGSLAADATYWVQLVPVNAAGLPGTPSSQVSGIPQSVPDNIPAGSVTGGDSGMIGQGVITGDNIAASSVTAAHIVAGTVLAGAIDGTVVQAAQYVAFGAQGEFLAYAGTPTAGNLLVSVSPTGGTDQFGNKYLHGLITYTSAGSPILAQGWQDGGTLFATASSQAGPYTVASASLRQAYGTLVNNFSGTTDVNGTLDPPIVNQIDAHTIVMSGRMLTPATGPVLLTTFATLGSPFLLPSSSGVVPEFPTVNAGGGQGGSVVLRPNGNMQLTGNFGNSVTVYTCGAFRF